MKYFPPRVALAIRTLGWGFHTVGHGIDPGDLRFRHRVVGVVHVWRISDPGMGSLPARVALAPRNPGWSFYTVVGGIDRGDHRFFPVCWSCRCTEANLIRGRDLILPRWRWLHETEVGVEQQPVALGFPHRTGRYRPGGLPFSSPVCWRCRCIEEFVMRG